MGMNKTWKEQEDAGERFEDLKRMLFKSLKPYFKFSGKLDLSKNDPTRENGDILAHTISVMLALSDKEDGFYFCADSVLAQQVTVENHKHMKFWGKIFWLSAPAGYESYKPGYDPFYGEFRLHENEIELVKIKLGDHQQTNLDKVWWFETELDWKYEFEA